MSVWMLTRVVLAVEFYTSSVKLCVPQDAVMK